MIFDQVLDFVKVRLIVVMTTESEGSFHVDDDSIDFWNVRLKSKTAELLHTEIMT